jgi:hypothetical protein
LFVLEDDTKTGEIVLQSNSNNGMWCIDSYNTIVAHTGSCTLIVEHNVI